MPGKRNLKTLWSKKAVKLITSYANSEFIPETGETKESLLIFEGFILDHIDDLVHLGDDAGDLVASIPVSQIKLILSINSGLFGSIEEGTEKGAAPDFSGDLN